MKIISSSLKSGDAAKHKITEASVLESCRHLISRALSVLFLCCWFGGRYYGFSVGRDVSSGGPAGKGVEKEDFLNMLIVGNDDSGHCKNNFSEFL